MFLYNEDRDVLAKSNTGLAAWLNNSHVHAAQMLPAKTFPQVGGLQEPSGPLAPAVSSSLHLQVHHVNNNYWVLSASKEGKLQHIRYIGTVYDNNIPF